MILYHGSDVVVAAPKLLKNQRTLDFGKGFYTTSDLDQATKWAKRTATRTRRDESFVSVYRADDEELNKLRVLRFEVPDVDWLRFVVANRTGRPLGSDWDVVAGPVANDQTATTIELFLNGSYDEEEALRRLLPQKLKDQYAFKTEEALALLHFEENIPL